MCDEIKWWETELMGWKWLFDGCQVSQVKTYLPRDLSDDDMQIWHQLHVSAKKIRWCWLAFRPLGTVWILSAWTGDEKGLWERAKAMKVKCAAGQVKSDADYDNKIHFSWNTRYKNVHVLSHFTALKSKILQKTNFMHIKNNCSVSRSLISRSTRWRRSLVTVPKLKDDTLWVQSSQCCQVPVADLSWERVDVREGHLAKLKESVLHTR